MRHLVLAITLALFGIASPGNNGFAGMITVDFDNAGKWTAGSGTFASIQSDHVYADQGFIFTGGPAFRTTTALQDSVASALGTYSWRLQNASGVTWTATYNTVSLNQITTLSFDARRWDNSPSPAYTVDYSVNGGSSFSSLVSLDNNAFDNSSAWKTFTFLLNTPVVSNNEFIVRFASAGTTERIMIDNFSVTAVPEPTSLVMVALAGASGFMVRRLNKKKLQRIAL